MHHPASVGVCGLCGWAGDAGGHTVALASPGWSSSMSFLGMRACQKGGTANGEQKMAEEHPISPIGKSGQKAAAEVSRVEEEKRDRWDVSKWRARALTRGAPRPPPAPRARTRAQCADTRTCRAGATLVLEPRLQPEPVQLVRRVQEAAESCPSQPQLRTRQNGGGGAQHERHEHGTRL